MSKSISNIEKCSITYKEKTYNKIDINKVLLMFLESYDLVLLDYKFNDKKEKIECECWKENEKVELNVPYSALEISVDF